MYSPLDRQSRLSQVQCLRKVFLLTVVVCALLLLLLGSSNRALSTPFRTAEGTTKQPRRQNVAVASHFRQHFDVHLSAVYTIRQVLRDQGSVQVFASTPLLHGFQEVVDSLGLYDQPIQQPDEFMDAMRSTSTSAAQQDKMIDFVLFGTCEVDMNRWSDELLAVWDARPADRKFKLVCIVHHFRDSNWQRRIAPWAARGAIRLLPIGYHVGRAFRAHFQELADNAEPDLYTSLYEYVDIDIHVPVLHLPEYSQRRNPIALSRAVIQGNFQIDRRDYPHVFADLLEVLKNDPEIWGYQPLGDSGVYESLLNSTLEPFELHLIGEGHLDIPKELLNIVVIHNGLKYVDFYALVQSMDIVVPAFVNKDYYDFQASSTVAMAVQCNVPILVSRRMRTAYGYIDDDRVTITRPQALREIHAIGVLRGAAAQKSNFTGTSIPIDGLGLDRYEGDLLDMQEHGWRRPTAGFEQFKRDLWEKNREAVWRLLDDLPGEIL